MQYFIHRAVLCLVIGLFAWATVQPNRLFAAETASANITRDAITADVAVSEPDLRIHARFEPAYNLAPGDTSQLIIEYENVGTESAQTAFISASLSEQLQMIGIADASAELTPDSDGMWTSVIEPGAFETVVIDVAIAEIVTTADIEQLPPNLAARHHASVSIETANDVNTADNTVRTELSTIPPLLLKSTSAETVVDQQLNVRFDWVDGEVLCCNRADTHSVDSAGVVGEFTDIAIGIDGNPFISYHDFLQGSLVVAHCKNRSCSSATTTELDSDDEFNNSLGTYTSVAIGRDGKPVISYYHTPLTALRVAKCADIACTSAQLVTVDDANAGKFSSITIGVDGNPIISYYDQDNRDLKVAHCDDQACESSTIRTVDNKTYVGEYSSIAIGRDGLPIISYYDNRTDDLKVAACLDIRCDSATLTTLDSTDRVGLYTSIAIAPDGLPQIAYYDKTNDELNMALCLDDSCSTAETTVVDSEGDVGQYATLAFGPTGQPILAYMNKTTTSLRLASCFDAFCDSAEFVDIAPFNVVGQYAAMAIGVDGMPVISHFHGGEFSNLLVSHGRGDSALVAVDFGDGSDVVNVNMLRHSSLLQAHIYTVPGVYTATLTVGEFQHHSNIHVKAELSDQNETYGLAWHVPSDIQLGLEIDVEANHVNKDNTNDGIHIAGDWEINKPITLSVQVAGTGLGTFVGWIDWDNNLNFDVDEIVVQETLDVGHHTFTVIVPDSFAGQSDVSMRFRLYDAGPRDGSAIYSPVGRGQGGEVEDYIFALTFVPTAVQLSAQSAEQLPTPSILVVLASFAALTLTTRMVTEQRKR